MVNSEVIFTLPIKLYTRRQVADLFGISYSSVPNLSKKGKVTPMGERVFLKKENNGAYTRENVVRFLRAMNCEKGAVLPR